MNRSLIAFVLIAAAGRADETTDPNKPTSPPLPAPNGLTFVKHIGGMRSPEGFEVKAVATLGADARALAFGDAGTLFVLHSGKTIVPYDGAKFSPSKSVLDGSFAAIASFDGWLYAANALGVIRIQGDRTQNVISGTGIVGLGVGPDGWLYVSTEEGDTTLIGSDGGKTGVVRTGALFRCMPDGKRLHVFAQGLRRPAGSPAFDSAANVFHIDADLPDAGRFTGCRLLHVADAADYGYRLAFGAKNAKPDPDRASAYGERPGTLAPLLKTGRGEPAGLFAYHDTRLPEAYRGLLLYPDPHDRTVRAYRVEPSGSTFRATEEFSFLAGGDEFRPVGVTAGPDGALYVLERSGKLWQMTWKGTTDEEGLKPRDWNSWAKVAKLDETDLIKTLADPDASVRERARLALMKRGEKSRPALLKLLTDEEADIAARYNALAAVQADTDPETKSAMMTALASGYGDLQRLAATALGQFSKSGDKEVHDALLRQMSDEDPGIRRVVALAIGRVGGPGAADNLAAAVAFDAGKCGVMRDGLLRALEVLGKPGIDALLALMDSGSQKEIDRTAIAFQGLRSGSAFAALPGLMRNPHLNGEQRAALIRSSVRYAGSSLDALVERIQMNDKETTTVKAALLDALATPAVVFGRRGSEWAMSLLADGPDDLRPRAVAVLRARLAAVDLDAEERRAIVKALDGK